MRRPVCARCEEPQTVKMAAHYWALRDDADVRSAWKQLVCIGCMAPTMTIVRANHDGYDGCIECGQETMTEDALRTLWLTLYIPGREPQQLQLDLCADHLDRMLDDSRRNSSLLPDRRGGNGGPPIPTPVDPWAAFH